MRPSVIVEGTCILFVGLFASLVSTGRSVTSIPAGGDALVVQCTLDQFESALVVGKEAEACSVDPGGGSVKCPKDICIAFTGLRNVTSPESYSQMYTCSLKSNCCFSSLLGGTRALGVPETSVGRPVGLRATGGGGGECSELVPTTSEDQCRECAVTYLSSGETASCNAGFRLPGYKDVWEPDDLFKCADGSNPSRWDTSSVFSKVFGAGDDDQESAEDGAEEDDSGSSCFPGEATVEVLGRGRLRIDALAVGDMALVGPGKYSEVLAFTHRDAGAKAVLVRLETESGAVLRATPGHFIPLVAKGSGAVEDLIAIEELTVGQSVMLGSGVASRIRSISSSRGEGLYNPQTVQGELVVSGVICSTYTRAVAPAYAHGAVVSLRNLQRLVGGWSGASFVLEKGRLDFAWGLVPELFWSTVGAR